MGDRIRSVRRGTALRTTPSPPALFDPLTHMPERIITAFFAEDLADGAVASWAGRGGVKNKTFAQATGVNQPTKVASPGGVKLTKLSTINMTFATDTDWPYLCRWGLVIAKCDLVNNAAAQVPVVTFNGLSTNAFSRQPMVEFAGPSTMRMNMHNGTSSVLPSATCDTSGWNIFVWWKRGRLAQCSCNGTWGTALAMVPFVPNNVSATSYIGTTSAIGADTEIDLIIAGQGELTDDQIIMLEGWCAHRKSITGLLPAQHPYKTNAPRIGLDVDHDKYSHVQADWDAWNTANSNTYRYTVRGTTSSSAPGIDTTGFETVFFDDFLSDTVLDDRTGAANGPWFAPGFNAAAGSGIGVDVALGRTNDTPDNYVHDGASALALRLAYNGSIWRAAAIFTMDLNGNAFRAWGGECIFECKFKMPNIAAPRPGFFPAFWGYAIEMFHWRTRPRQEVDYCEYDGLDGAWLNGGSTHVHAPALSGYTGYGDTVSSSQSKKINGGGSSQRLITGTGSLPSVPLWPGPDIDVYDGVYHTFRWTQLSDHCYLSVDGILCARVQTTPRLLKPRIGILDLAYDDAKGAAALDTGQSYDMTVDYFKVMKKSSDIAVPGSGFTARPTISGTAASGQTLTCTPNITSTHLEYMWMRETGEPIAYNTNSATYVVQAGDVGSKIRCLVRSRAHRNWPEAYTALTGTVS